mmetsp:Transcript_4769/g.10269  ORF Transcript_4769/g.10269 Transcript_4769/m.10269 type:complete len:445 (-) Transcript_4769:855-2189(-)|eukprot:CAMPEP_0202901322 /NCGR_PEP_ID=MMETSP1392-20130828/14189_1 /ASSEMBLY_ACC=CAM_ASM_000868 /TAXON_ID=225041 /ORGANISM="Chlamydomonas chlamydogama, Strain SAG 11-48b" /LENGTH=444 /DNA_ID=CAMNT_0049587869 /DNA_START=235 /DNA_END=1569 /DNA_ORIENTATION=+
MQTDSDSEDERLKGYQPVLAEKLGSGRMNSPSLPRPQSAHLWPKDGVSVYHNELFTDGDVLGGAPGGAGEDHFGNAPAGANRPGSSHKMIQQRSTLAARRQERMQANIYERNESMASRNISSPMAQGPSMRQPVGSADVSRSQQMPSIAGHGGNDNVYGLRSSYDPNEEDGGGVRTVASRQQAPASIPQGPRLDLSDLRAFLGQAGPKTGPVLCYIVRDKGSAKMYPKYNLFLEQGKQFLLAARKRKKQTTSNYIISLDYDDLGRDSEKFFGKLRANFVGTEFTVYDQGDKPGKKSGSGQARQELGCVTYQYNVLGTRGPRKMTACIPAVDGSGRRLYRPTSDADNMLDRVKNNTNLDELIIMRNKPPRWNEELNAYCLNFNGRVTEASVKNFQLVTDDNQNHVILQFGKIGKNTFTMDYQWPISALQAFAICLSSFDNKLACE